DEFAGATGDFSRAIALEPANPDWLARRSQARMALDNWEGVLEDAETWLRLKPGAVEAVATRGWAMVNLGEVDAGLAEQDRAFELSGANPLFRARFDAYLRKADWTALTAEAEGAIAGRSPRGGLDFYRVVGLVGQKRWDEAAAAVEEARRRGATTEADLGGAWLAGTPEAGRHFSPPRSIQLLDSAAQLTISGFLNTRARTLFLGGSTDQCLDYLSTRGRRGNPETLFWMGACYWKLGRLAEAGAVLRDARRLNPYLVRHAEAVPGLREFVAGIDREIAGEGAGGALRFELATHLMSVAEIEGLVRRFRFARAVKEYEALLASVTSSVRRAEIEARLPELRGLAGAHGKLTAAINAGTLTLKTRLARTDLTIVKSGDETFDFTVPSGSGRFPWAFFETAAYVDFARQAVLTPAELSGLACLAWDAGARDLAVQLFEEAAKKNPALRPGIAASVARRRGIAVPEGGFLAFRGRYVSPAEKAQLEKGLVEWDGGWVPAEDRAKLAQGFVRVGGDWVRAAEADLLARGFRQHGGRWLSRADYDAARSVWADAWVEETPHAIVKTNHSEAFSKDLAALVEAAWPHLRELHGGEPAFARGGKLTLHAFRTFDDYRRHCVEHRAEDQLAAAGFARSDLDVAAGWNKTGNDRHFLQTMVHEAAHLFAFRASPAARSPSWYSEGMATALEGFRWNGSAFVFDFLSDLRLPFARAAARGVRAIPLKELLAADALTLIRTDSSRALVFYGQCWSLHFFLSRTANPAWRKAWGEYREMVRRGGTRDFLEFFPDADRLEKDWVEFVKGL
ncbi:MAG: hypothetical protein HUU15_18435, partial [Candidatus Brocadiae bacterium]|nr:hypothetical protein [Candidatus Brocadiia bacterium]